MGKIFESLGAVVTKDDTIVNVTIDSRILFKNGVSKKLDADIYSTGAVYVHPFEEDAFGRPVFIRRHRA